jgi:hypothetical protein
MRNDFPLSGGKVSMIQQKDITNVRLSYSSVASKFASPTVTKPDTSATDPTTLDEFTPLASNYSSLSYGLSCTDAPDFAAAGLTAGTNVTIALEYTYGSVRVQQLTLLSLTIAQQHAYQYLSCSDVRDTKDRHQVSLIVAQVTLVDPSEWQKSLVCINAMVPQAQALAMTNGTSNAVFSLHSDSGLSATAGGGIGASVTLVVIGAVLAALLAMGLLSFGRKSHKVPHELHVRFLYSSSVAMLTWQTEQRLGIRAVRREAARLKRDRDVEEGRDVHSNLQIVRFKVEVCLEIFALPHGVVRGAVTLRVKVGGDRPPAREMDTITTKAPTSVRACRYHLSRGS